MRPLLIVATLVALDLSLIPQTVVAQSLGEIAAREKERRKGKVERVITEEDLRRSHRAAEPADDGESAASDSTTSAQSSSTSASGSTDKPEKTEEELRAERRKDWQDRQTKTEQDVARLTDEIGRLQSSVSDQRAYQLGPNRAKMLERLEAAKQELATAQAKLEDLEEERRREGF